MSGHLELRDGSIVSLASLPRRVPHPTFQGPLHAEVAERLVTELAVPAELHRVYVNFVTKKSSRAKQLSALVALARAGRVAPAKVVSDFIGPGFADLLPEGVRIERSEPPAANLIDRAQLPREWAKLLLHRTFRLLGPWRRPAPHVLRAWVDTSDAMYPKEVEQARLLVYPFDKNPARQLRYLWTCWRAGRSFALAGYPLRARKLLRATLERGRRDRLLVDTEASAARAHAEELLALGVERVSTTDEFEVAACELHDRLGQSGVTSVNSSHGVAVYGPYASYSHFRFFNDLQRDFYAGRGRFDDSSVRHGVADATAAPRAPEDFAPVLVLIQGNWARAGKHYEAEFEAQVTAAASRTADACGLPFVVKRHPNARRPRPWSRPDAGAPPTIDRIEEAPGRHPVFVNTLSSACYELAKRGPVLFAADGLLDPRGTFGPDIHCVHVDALADEIQRFREARYWQTRFDEGLGAPAPKARTAG